MTHPYFLFSALVHHVMPNILGYCQVYPLCLTDCLLIYLLTCYDHCACFFGFKFNWITIFVLFAWLDLFMFTDSHLFLQLCLCLLYWNIAVFIKLLHLDSTSASMSSSLQNTLRTLNPAKVSQLQAANAYHGKMLKGYQEQFNNLRPANKTLTQ